LRAVLLFAATTQAGGASLAGARGSGLLHPVPGGDARGNGLPLGQAPAPHGRQWFGWRLGRRGRRGGDGSLFRERGGQPAGDTRGKILSAGSVLYMPDLKTGYSTPISDANKEILRELASLQTPKSEKLTRLLSDVPAPAAKNVPSPAAKR